MFCVKYIVLFTLFATNLIDQPTPEVDIDQGTLRGRVSSDGLTFEYMGIPYATTQGRYQAPLPPPSWDGVFKAVNEHYQCPQAVLLGIIGAEDCLRINIYVKAHTQALLPVMVYIHGGGFLLGNGGKLVYGADFLVRHDVVVVTFNYRLGVLGFLCLGIKEAPGNAGLKDQIAALRWIKKNIAAFGGDPDNVTIFGHSAGAASASLLIASETTDGLFHRAIIQSGSAITYWSSLSSGIIAKSIAKYLSFYVHEDLYKLYEIYNSMPLSEIVFDAMGKPVVDLIKSNLIHLPCIEKKFPGIETVIHDIPYNLLMRNPKNISIIYGITDNEGIYLTAEETEKTVRKLNYDMLYPSDLEFPSREEAEAFTKKLKFFYFGDKAISLNSINNLSDLYGDVSMTVPTILESEIMLNRSKAPIYHYCFKYSGGRNMIKERFAKNKLAFGASHGDDITYLFNAYIWPYRVSAKDQKIVDWMTKMWTNFAKFGDPTPSAVTDLPLKWKPSTKESLNFLYIDDEMKMGPLPYPERYELWKNIYAKYRKNKL